MTQEEAVVNNIAPLTNVALCAGVLEQAISRPGSLPGLVSFYGPSGYGKSFAAAYAANRYNAYHVACKKSWTTKAFLQNVLKEMGIKEARTISDMADQVAEQLSLSGRPLIIDEFDYMVAKGYEEIVRDVYEGSNAAILLIGEEQLETNLSANERFHNRVLKWVPAQPATYSDAELLKQLYSPKIVIGDDLLKKIMTAIKGCTRRLCINLHNVQSFAIDEGHSHVSLTEWADQPIYIGKAPQRKVA